MKKETQSKYFKKWDQNFIGKKNIFVCASKEPTITTTIQTRKKMNKTRRACEEAREICHTNIRLDRVRAL